MAVLRAVLLAIAYLGGVSLNEAHGFVTVELRDRLFGVTVQSRQLSCTLPSDYPQSCLDTFNQLTSTGAQVFAAVTVTLALRITLDGVCTSECLDPAVEFFRCLGEENLAEAYESGVCGQEAGLYCYELYLKGVGDSIIPTRTAPCSNYTASIDYLGCCAESLFSNPEISSSFFPFNDCSFTNCSLDLGNRCIPPTSAAGELAIRVNAKWIVFIAFIALANLLGVYWI